MTSQLWAVNVDFNALSPAHSSSAIHSWSGQPLGTNLSRQAAPISDAGTAQVLSVSVDTAPGVGNTLTVTVIKNGASSALTVTISGTDTTGETIVDVALTRLDMVYLDYQWTGSGLATNLIRVTTEFLPDKANYFVYPGVKQVVFDGVAGRLAALHVGDTQLWSSSDIPGLRTVIPISGTLRTFVVNMTTITGTYTFILQGNSSEVAATLVSIGSPSLTGVASSLSTAVTAGDEYSFKVKSVGNAATRILSWCSTIESAVAGEFFWNAQATGSPSATLTTYPTLTAAQGTPAQPETSSHIYMPKPVIVGKGYASLQTAPGAGKSRTFTARKNATTALSTTFQIADTAKTGNDATHENTLVAGDLINYSLIPSGTPTAWASATWSLAARMVTTPGTSGGAPPSISPFKDRLPDRFPSPELVASRNPDRFPKPELIQGTNPIVRI
jgi:hypothetical protein